MTATAAFAARPHRPLMARFLAFELRRILRAPSFLILALAFPIVFYLASYANPTNNVHAKSTYGTSWPIYFMVSMIAWAAVSAAFDAAGGRMAAERANGWTRQLRLTPLPSWAYASGKALAAESVALAAALVLALVTAGAERPSLSAGAWAALILACWIGSLPLAAIGIFLGLIVSSAAAQPVMIAATLALNVFGGLLMPLQSLPAVAARHRPRAAHLPAREPRLEHCRPPGLRPGRRRGARGLHRRLHRPGGLALPGRSGAAHRVIPRQARTSGVTAFRAGSDSGVVQHG